MSEYVELISKKRLYEKIARLEMEAKNKLAKTPRDSEEYIRYETQFNERSAFKHMVMDAREVDVEQKLASYEKAEEQGLLLRLPCRVGDVVYLVDFEEKDCDEATVWSIEIDTKDNRILINSDYEVGTYAFDSRVFYTKAEAEKALAEMEGKESKV